MKKIFQCAAVRLALLILAIAPLQARSFSTVVIDPGHGGHDKGCQWGRVYEKHLCLDTSLRLENALRKKGYRTAVLRRSDEFISLPQRVSMAARYSNSIFVSVHYNFTWRQEASGIETFYSTPQSQSLAYYVNKSIMKRVKVVNRGVKTARYYVIRNALMPAILVECGFVSNPSERSNMRQAWYRQSVADGIADGISIYRSRG
jgi:N-acetylmuramoyl-L-alanine amidase